MHRVFDPIDIVFIVLISLYLILFTITMLFWRKTRKKIVKPVRYKVIKIIHPKKKSTTKKKTNSKRK